ncbi:MAG: GntR family transcriptional regulator, partial [Aeromicrobium sp.]|uniref:GntR family transcriptional regulator n=1 Tax=Aeromicrobium sp. TaxID=1871063 RepID=UPI0039E26F63
MSGARPSAAEEVFARLREQILTGQLSAGSRQSIYRLSDSLGVSRTPVREAVLRLADLGLVTVERNRGIVVRGVRAEDVRDVFELRLLLEVPAASAAAAAADAGLVDRLRAALGA